MRTILVFGHEDLDYDNGAVKLIGFLKENLKDCVVYKVSRPEQIMEYLGKDFVILDVAKGIDRPIFINNVDNIKYSKKVTEHDIDLASFMKILESLGELKEIKIVAIPYDKDPHNFKEEVIKLIKNA